MARVDNTKWENKKVTAGGVSKSLNDWMAKLVDAYTIFDFGTVATDGTTDSLAAFQAAASSGKRVIIPYRPNPYVISSYLEMASNTQFIGLGLPMIKTMGVARAFRCNGVDDVVIDGFTFDFSAGTSDYCIYINNCQRVKVLNNVLPSPKADLIVTGTSSHCEVRRNRITSAASTAITLLGAVSNNEVTENLITGSVGFGIWLTQGATKNLIQGNKTTSNGIELIGVTHDAYENRIIGNHAEGCGDNGISVTGYRNVVMGNMCRGNQKAGIWSWGSHNSITGNECLNNNLENAGNNWAGVGVSGNFGGTGQYNIISSNVIDDDQASPTQWNNIRLAGSSYTLWAAGQVIASNGVYRYYGLNLYVSTTSGTTGATPPTHTTGTVSDGTVSWRYVRSFLNTVVAGYNTIGPNILGRSQSSSIIDVNNSNTNIYLNQNGVPFILATSAVVVSHTGDTSEFVLGTVSIPAAWLGPNGSLRIPHQWSHTNNANTKTLRIRLGGIGGTIIYSAAQTTVAQTLAETWLQNKNSHSAQVFGSIGNRTTDTVAIVSQIGTAAVDTSAQVDIVFTSQCANAADSISLDRYVVEIIRRQ